MSLKHTDDLLTDTHAPDQPVPSGEFNTIARILDRQAFGALEAIGEGVVGADDWIVTAGVADSVDISAGAGIRDSALHGHVFMQTASSTNLASLPINSTVYVYATLVFRVAPGDPDSREDGSVEFTYNLTGGTVADSILLAHFTTDGTGAPGVITDDRVFIAPVANAEGIEGWDADLDAIREAIGLDYFGGAPPAASVDARLDDLEIAPTGATFWGVLKKAPGDATLVDQQIDSDVQAHVDTYHTGGHEFYAEETPWDEDAVNQGKGVLKLTRSVDPEHALHMIDCVVLVWTIWGDGTAGSPDYVDAVNSTWVP